MLCSYKVDIFRVTELWGRAYLSGRMLFIMREPMSFSDIHSYEVKTAHEILLAIFLYNAEVNEQSEDTIRLFRKKSRKARGKDFFVFFCIRKFHLFSFFGRFGQKMPVTYTYNKYITIPKVKTIVIFKKIEIDGSTFEKKPKFCLKNDITA